MFLGPVLFFFKFAAKIYNVGTLNLETSHPKNNLKKKKSQKWSKLHILSESEKYLALNKSVKQIPNRVHKACFHGEI